MSCGETFAVRLRALPGPVPADQRIKRFLKHALRAYGLRNEGFIETPSLSNKETPMSFQKATREESKLRLGLIGPSGSGKTYTALRVATFLGGRIAVIDTERKSASKYAPPRGQAADPEGGTFDFESCGLADFAPEKYVAAIKEAEHSGFDVLVIDSLSHAWMGKGGALEMHDLAVDRQKSKNTYTAWREVTPHHNALVDALLQSPCHVIVTMRAKTDYVQEEDERGKKSVRKIGMAPIQRDGLDYEFDITGDLDLDNKLVIGKTRCRALKGRVFAQPGAEFAGALKEWLAIGAPAAEEVAASAATRDVFSAQIKGAKSLDELKEVAAKIKTAALLPAHVKELQQLYREARDGAATTPAAVVNGTPA